MDRVRSNRRYLRADKCTTAPNERARIGWMESKNRSAGIGGAKKRRTRRCGVAFTNVYSSASLIRYHAAPSDNTITACVLLLSVMGTFNPVPVTVHEPLPPPERRIM
jgi:hypothetical protein